ncbi:MAG TPA: bifunctional 2-polyprenyl-6-hydroxyphenol methylase/3-demethylubiquinol 3-O-methyltransferase UbiG [Spirochaetota bacterium]|nr:bifunctional 2-polyprenyl-6-hydroxyphenol methylase/3-demethylubiquinol 3-O-methyltransferase UbiG [Spirochaetota bacterium]HPC41396.1 bifunctional 2-polyprenyl-6-hydroxyphenol methylase/3-demethylubiquinol 3-O-methyltransferase UbiG [Spirochaetota bacterium]HPL16505.1 bifunctional 2-polyprenyl-6-hydroxyphenol methylase/3-demethylubiquinol 3-O-methyltransferase UbiG [Spirochaetota bacterium]HQF09222.1 bifunctional 2-polyprenyl-6-hydroxyphenol methylase/3-demethylubiquinol 3-O-methyltransferas
MKINNEIYDRLADYWWDEGRCGSLATIRYFVNSARFNYFFSVLNKNPRDSDRISKLLDVGCGGGFLSEEFAKAGFNVTGIDPSKNSIAAARKHAEENNLHIRYVHGNGEHLPFGAGAFSIVTCCDVLEHVADLNAVISEIARVLAAGGIFFYDTMNRTFAGKVIVKATQEWKSTSFMEPCVHNWEMFIKPAELFRILRQNNLKPVEIKGMSPGLNLLSHYLNMRKCKKGKLSYRELGDKLNIHITNNTAGVYTGYAVKL